ncbi:Centrosomal protein [Liparis tanakae]|uniref:Centrosomal protein n=1 Tax=Liparis tanakae TaxID=230148 RepID=A0A4Z2I5A5_9TELE|nr:Centrosomal protein [Liparis tanakae]
MALLKEVRALQIIPGELVKPFKSNFPSRPAQSRTELLQKLLADLGTETSGFTPDNVMTNKERFIG